MTHESLVREHGDENPAFNLRDLLGVARRRWLYFVLTFVFVLSVSGFVVLKLSPIYRSSGTIYVESQQIPQEIVRSMVTGYVEERIQVVTQLVMTHENLSGIVNEFGLYTDMDVAISDKIDLLRDSTLVETISTGRRRGSTSVALEVSFEHGDPKKAQEVASELVRLFMAENARTRTQRATETTEFLTQELEKLRTIMESVEVRMADFKQANRDILPENLSLNEAKLDRVNALLRTVERDQAAAIEQHEFYELQLAAIRSGAEQSTGRGSRNVLTPAERLMQVQNELVSKEAEFWPDHPDIMKLRRQIAAFQALIISSGGRGDVELGLSQAKLELERLRNLYTDKHPEVKSQLLLIEDLETRLTRLPEDSLDVALGPAERELMAKIRAAATRIKSFEEEKSELLRQIQVLESRIERTPQVEREIVALQRDYENASSKYQEIKSKQLEAQLSQRMEESQKAERFSLIEAPMLPEGPVRPERKKLLLLCFFLSGGAGLGLVFLLEWLDSGVRNAQQITRVFGEPPIVILPYIDTAEDIGKRAATRRYLIGSAAGAFVLLLASVHFYYKPLGTISELLIKKLGLG